MAWRLCTGLCRSTCYARADTTASAPRHQATQCAPGPQACSKRRRGRAYKRWQVGCGSLHWRLVNAYACCSRCPCQALPLAEHALQLSGGAHGLWERQGGEDTHHLACGGSPPAGWRLCKHTPESIRGYVTGRFKDALIGSCLQEDAEAHCTAPYRAPELFDVPSHCIIDERVDVWSLGCLL